LNGISMLASTPLPASNEMPVRTMTTLVPSIAAASAARSQRTQTSASQSLPAGLASSTTSSPCAP
jgi:hypothetical protein